MKKILHLTIFVAAISFFVCDQDLTGYELLISLTATAKIILTSKVHLLD